jgi:hypothetical protein
MKTIKLLSLLLLLCAGFNAFAQNDDEDDAPRKVRVNRRNGVCPVLYLGLSTGLNNESGIMGFNIDLPLNKKLSLGAGFGEGTWGAKAYSEVRYYITERCHRGWALGAGITYASGSNNFKQTLETINGKEKVTLNLHPQDNVFFALYRFWSLGREYNRIYANIGYSVPFHDARYKVIYGDPLTQSTSDGLRSLSPGGLVVGAGISFGIHEKRR